MRLHTLQRLIWIAPLAIASLAVAQDHAPADSHDAATEAMQAAENVGHGEEHGASANPMQWKLVPYVSSLIVFGAAFFILSKTAWPKISQGLTDREEKIRKEITEAENARKNAESALAEYQKSLSEARTEAGKILEQAKQDHQKIAAELRAKTESELNAMRDAARRDIESAKQQAVGEIYEHMSNVATSIAGKILKKEISAADQKSLVEESLNQLAAAGSN
jgi:F-type H+-transporting ATPase subunit b